MEYKGKLWVAMLLLVGIAAVAAEGKSVKKPIALNEDNWEKMLTGEWMVEFYAPWCPACKNLAPTWERFAMAAYEFDVRVAVIDVTTSPSLSGRFIVTAMPTIYHVKNGQFRQYRGSRDGDALITYIEQHQWEKTEPLSAWKRPDTIHMSILSYFFKLSHALKDFNAQLQDEYGLPTWGSYALFAIGTIFVGAALGLLLVCVVDFIFPPKKSHRQSFSEARQKSLGEAVEDLVNDELLDDADGDEDDEDDEPKNSDDEDDDDAENENDIEAISSTSEGEKNSNSESDEPESEKKQEAVKGSKDKSSGGDAEAAVSDQTLIDATADDVDTTQNPNTTPPKVSPGEMRKRKPRKDD